MYRLVKHLKWTQYYKLTVFNKNFKKGQRTQQAFHSERKQPARGPRGKNSLMCVSGTETNTEVQWAWSAGCEEAEEGPRSVVLTGHVKDSHLYLKGNRKLRV